MNPSDTFRTRMYLVCDPDLTGIWPLLQLEDGLLTSWDKRINSHKLSINTQYGLETYIQNRLANPDTSKNTPTFLAEVSYNRMDPNIKSSLPIERGEEWSIDRTVNTHKRKLKRFIRGQVRDHLQSEDLESVPLYFVVENKPMEGPAKHKVTRIF